MPKFNHARARAGTFSPLIATAKPGATGHQGAPAYERDARSELFVTAVSNMVNEGTYYENAQRRDNRFAQLVRTVAADEPDWLARFISWLRDKANMRSSSLVAACEGAWAMHKIGHGGGRKLIDAACSRADEPGELLAYWISHYGQRLPKPVKRGLADAARRLYNEKAALKYDTASHAVRFADVIELCRPRPRDAKQDDLFCWLLDRRPGAGRKVGGKRVTVPDSLATVAANRRLRRSAAVDAAVLTDAEALKRSGMTWEEALSAAGDRVDKAALWEAKIPSMGYMALLRNLRNFDQAGISEDAAYRVCKRLSNSSEVAASRQLPFRFLSAYQAVSNLRWAYSLEQALNHSLANIPAVPGRSLILVDRSGSMFSRTSQHSNATWADTAALFGTALALRAEHARLVQFGTGSGQVSIERGTSLLKAVERFGHLGGTNTAAALSRHYAGHDRVIIITDEQAQGGYYAYGHRPVDLDTIIPAWIPMYTWNLVGYQYGHAPSGTANRHTFAGLNDTGFRAIDMIEAGAKGQWPF